MLPAERGAGLGLGSNYGLRYLWLGREIRRTRRRRRLNAAETAAAAPTLKLTPCLPHLFVCTRLERVEAAVRRQRGRIGGGIEPERQDAQVSAELTGEACGRIELEAGCTQQRSWPTCEPKARREPAQS